MQKKEVTRNARGRMICTERLSHEGESSYVQKGRVLRVRDGECTVQTVGVTRSMRERERERERDAVCKNDEL